ncbi:hypothetical protein HPB51_021394 [Rhipicephalus microplus]|uniref:Uncharacterized protein n=1 Tax=Rhipicephalus microplus TaxID=6941 RepID=A0A9J6F6B3_RHIMP|nr:hypothetical protein HPB51_021394 [Rhipicephalus microplus]
MMYILTVQSNPTALSPFSLPHPGLNEEHKVGQEEPSPDQHDTSIWTDPENILHKVTRQQCRAFEALKTRRILPKFGRLDNVPTVASIDVATCEDIPFLVRRVVREELVRLQAADVHHQCSFASCPEPIAGCESATSKTDHAQKLQISPRGFRFPRWVVATTGCHHLDVPLRTSDRRQPGLYQKITMRHHKMFLRSTTRLRVLLSPLLLLISMGIGKLVRVCGQFGRRLMSSSSRVHENRGPFATLSDVDVATFERLLGPSAVLTEPADMEAFNVDWLRTCRGEPFHLAPAFT